MSVPSLKIGGVTIALDAFPATQSYRRLGGSELLRFRGGGGLLQTHWAKIGTRIGGNGWAPPALAGVDWTAAVEIHCIQPRSIWSATVAATLPSARRSDVTDSVLAFALVGVRLVSTPVSVITNAATATAVSGASGYEFRYYPKLNFICKDGVDEDMDTSTGVYSWAINGEEV